MPLRLHNTLSGRVEEFRPLRAGEATFYTCGPTVYDFAHIGNFRSFLTADVLRRWLESPLCARLGPDGTPDGGLGYRVTQVMNITDVGHMTDDAAADGGGEDKMELASRRLLEDKKSGKLPPGVAQTMDPGDPYAIASYYAGAFLQDAAMLGLRVVEQAAKDPSLMPRPTQMVGPMLEMILSLIDKGHAYIAADGVVYFDTQSFPDYGRLSGNTLDRIRSGAGGRVSDSTQAAKRHPADFMLWKPDPRHLMRWDPSRVLGRTVPLKEGYPGWHIECSAMARGRLGEQIDLHSGGEDNIFPHHECEIAQSRCATGRPSFANYWVHTRFLQVEGAKMSKSKGNFFTVRDLVARGFSPAAIRLELIKTHYRSNANFTEQGLKDSTRNIERWREAVRKGGLGASATSGVPDPGSLSEPARRVLDEFAAAMNDDLNVAGAIGAVNAWLNKTPAPTRDDAAALLIIDGTLGVLGRAEAATAAAGAERSAEDLRIDDLVRRRTEARSSKNWPEADRIRDELNALNIAVEDTPAGPKWSRKATL